MVKFARDAKRDYQSPLKGTPTKIFKKRIEEMEYESMGDNTPFCRACAWNTFNNNLRIKKENKIEDTGFCGGNDPVLMDYAEKLDLKQFVGKDKFNLLNTAQANEEKMIDGSKMNVQVGWHLNYNCKKSRMHNCCVFLTLNEYETQRSKKKPVKGSGE